MDAHIRIINSRKGGQIKIWLKACGLKAKRTVEESRRTLIQYLQKQAELSTSPLITQICSVPKSLVKDLVLSLTDEGICTQLDELEIKRKETAEKRKNSLLCHLYEKYCPMTDTKRKSTVNKSKILKQQKRKNNTVNRDVSLRTAATPNQYFSKDIKNDSVPEKLDEGVGAPTTVKPAGRSSRKLGGKSKDGTANKTMFNNCNTVAEVEKNHPKDELPTDDTVPDLGNKRKRKKKASSVAPCSSEVYRSNVYDTAIETLQTKLIAVDEKLDRQQCILNNISDRIGNALAADTASALEAISHSNKEIFKSLKAQEAATSKEISLIKGKLSDLRIKEKKAIIGSKETCFFEGKLREDFESLSQVVLDIKNTMEQDRKDIFSEIQQLKESLEKMQKGKEHDHCLRSDEIDVIIAAERKRTEKAEKLKKLQCEKQWKKSRLAIAFDHHHYCTKAQRPQNFEPSTEVTNCPEDEGELVLNASEFFIAANETVCVEEKQKGQIGLVTQERTPSPQQPIIDSDDRLLNNESAQRKRFESEIVDNFIATEHHESVLTTSATYITDSLQNDEGSWTKIQPRYRKNSEKSRNSDGRKARKLSSQKKTKILVIHDSFYGHFDSTRFSSFYDVETIKYESLRSIIRKGSIIDEVNKIKPEIVFIHVGLDDIRMKNRTNEDIIKDFKLLIGKLIDDTSAKICLSTPAPTPQFEDLKRHIDSLNIDLSTLIIDVRDRLGQNNRMYSCGNNNLSGYVKSSVGSAGITFSLTEVGKLRLFARLRDTLIRIHNDQTSLNSNNHE